MQAFADAGITFHFPTFATPAMLRDIRAAVPGKIGDARCQTPRRR